MQRPNQCKLSSFHLSWDKSYQRNDKKQVAIPVGNGNLFWLFSVFFGGKSCGNCISRPSFLQKTKILRRAIFDMGAYNRSVLPNSRCSFRNIRLIEWQNPMVKLALRVRIWSKAIDRNVNMLQFPLAFCRDLLANL